MLNISKIHISEVKWNKWALRICLKIFKYLFKAVLVEAKSFCFSAPFLFLWFLMIWAGMSFKERNDYCKMENYATFVSYVSGKCT